MDRNSAIARLPEAYATVIRLTEAGADRVTIAAGLGIEVEALGPLLDVASLKLVELLAAEDA